MSSKEILRLLNPKTGPGHIGSSVSTGVSPDAFNPQFDTTETNEYNQAALDAFYDQQREIVREKGLVDVDSTSDIAAEIGNYEYQTAAEQALLDKIQPLDFSNSINSASSLTISFVGGFLINSTFSVTSILTDFTFLCL